MSRKAKDMAGLRFGRLVVIERAPSTNNSGARWRCRCDCGTEKVILGGDLRRTGRSTVSCGCFHRETIGARLARGRAISISRNRFMAALHEFGLGPPPPFRSKPRAAKGGAHGKGSE